MCSDWHQSVIVVIILLSKKLFYYFFIHNFDHLYGLLADCICHYIFSTVLVVTAYFRFHIWLLEEMQNGWENEFCVKNNSLMPKLTLQTLQTFYLLMFTSLVLKCYLCWLPRIGCQCATFCSMENLCRLLPCTAWFPNTNNALCGWHVAMPNLHPIHCLSLLSFPCPSTLPA